MNGCCRCRWWKEADALAVVAVGLAVLSAAAMAGPPTIIPWRDQRPALAPAHPPLAPPCRAHDLRAHIFLQGATGSLVGELTLTNQSSACALLGWPRIAFAGAAAKQAAWQVRRIAGAADGSSVDDALTDPPGSLRAWERGKSAQVALVWSNWCGPGSSPAGSSGERPSSLVVKLLSGGALRLPLARAPRCDSPSAPSKLTVAPFRPASPQLPSSSELSLRLTIVAAASGGNGRLGGLEARRGSLLRYRLAVKNSGATSYRFRRPCPLYVEQLNGERPQAYVLNCRATGPIAPGHSLVFAMEIPVPPSTEVGSNELTLWLAPRTFNAPVAQAPVVVR